MSETPEPSTRWSSPSTAHPPREPGPFQIPGFWIAWIVSGLAGAAFGAFWIIHVNAAPDLGDSVQSLSLLGLSGHLGLLLGIILGLCLGDRFPKRRAVKLCFLLMAALSAIAGVVGLSGIAPVALLYLSYVAIGVLSGLSTPLIWGLVAELMPRTLLAKAIVMLSWSGLIASLLGVLVGTLVFSRVLWETPYWVAFLYVASLFAIAGLLISRLPQYAGSARFAGGFRDAVGLLIRARRLRALWLYGIVMSGCLAVFSSSIEIFAYFDLEGRLDLGWLLLAQGGAGTVASVGLVFVISGRRGWPTLLVSGGIAAILCISIGAADTFWPLMALMIPFGAGSTAAALGSEALAMSHTKLGYFGRVTALLFVGGSISSTAIALLGITLGDWGQGRSLIIAVGVILLMASLLLYRTWRATREESSVVDGVAQAPSSRLMAEIAAPQKPAASD